MSQSPTVTGAILAAGSGSRFGSDKTLAKLGDKPLLMWSVEAFSCHPRINEVIVVGGENLTGLDLPSNVTIVAGGATRAESSRRALDACQTDILLVHDAARPFVSLALIDRVIDGVLELGAAAPAVPVTDTVRNQHQGLQLIDRTHLLAMQTPQGALTSMLKVTPFLATATDEMALLSKWKPVEGDPNNFKITTQADWLRAQRMIQQFPEFRTGLGYDIHRFSTDATRPLWLGGVLFEGQVGLEGHSDADVLLHAAVDALLGAASLGDIGQHFPPSDARWKDEASINFLVYTKALLDEAGWTIVNLDIAAVAEAPKLMPRSEEIRAKISGALSIEASRVSLKATTNEGLGAIGRSEGIAAFATATLRRP